MLITHFPSFSSSKASGEAQFVNDIPNFQHELFGAFVITEQASATLESVDPTDALVCVFVCWCVGLVVLIDSKIGR